MKPFQFEKKDLPKILFELRVGEKKVDEVESGTK